jgi:hypothetical protein
MDRAKEKENGCMGPQTQEDEIKGLLYEKLEV